jgi:putative ABC transport system ATP-binding protein
MAGFVRMERVSKRYPLGDGSVVRAADCVTLEIVAGQRTALVGPSGSGKSTLLHLMGAIDVPDEGRITVGTVEVTGLSRRRLADYRAGIGFVFQQFHLLSALTAVDNVAAPLVSRCPSRERRERAEQMLEAVGLADRAGARPEQLSGGQQQRVAIARALIVRPRLLLADEPTGNLDSATAAEVLDLLGDIQHRYATTLVIATHDRDVAAYCDDVVEVRDGRAQRMTANSAGKFG